VRCHNSLRSFQRMEQRIGLAPELAQTLCCSVCVRDIQRALERSHDLGPVLSCKAKREPFAERCSHVLDDITMGRYEV
jgi:hypothetical protein